jgi:FkbM family methyltransferase
MKYGLRRILRGLKNRPERFVYRKLLERLVRRSELRLEALGSRTASWIVPVDLFRSEWTCYCGGVGEDITFDLELIRRFMCDIYAFDPTPRAIERVNRVAAGNERFHFFPYGLWSSDTELKFFASRNPKLVNHSVVNLQGTDMYFVAPCRRITSVMRELGHTRIDFLKIDIEGAEYEVLDSLIEDGVDSIRVLCVEFDQPAPITRVFRQTQKIRAWGYDLVKIDNCNLTFVRHGEGNSR